MCQLLQVCLRQLQPGAPPDPRLVLAPVDAAHFVGTWPYDRPRPPGGDAGGRNALRLALARAVAAVMAEDIRRWGAGERAVDRHGDSPVQRAAEAECLAGLLGGDAPPAARQSGGSTGAPPVPAEVLVHATLQKFKGMVNEYAMAATTAFCPPS